jgi:hypothetical protein
MKDMFGMPIIQKPLKKVMQTRFHSESTRGNCYAAVIASIMGKDSAESVIQIQEHYDDQMWPIYLMEWLEDNGYELMTIDGHQYDNSYYFVTGMSPRDRSITHICIYQNGQLVHDPHPDGTGILNFIGFSQLEKFEP